MSRLYFLIISRINTNRLNQNKYGKIKPNKEGIMDSPGGMNLADILNNKADIEKKAMSLKRKAINLLNSDLRFSEFISLY
jgi:hypothetical protein